MAKYFAQETDYSCGASALRNCLSHFGIELTEKYLRNICNTKRKNGTEPKDLYSACKNYFNVREIVSISPNVFQRRITKGLKNEKVFIVSTDSHWHWISVLQYYKRKVLIIDSDYNKGLKHWVTMKQLIELSFGYEKNEDKKSFYALELEKE